jgi:GNAT superfamily N-acetyltransferase
VEEDRERILDILGKRGVFNSREIEVAAEVLQASFEIREEVEYHAFCAADGNGPVQGYICFGPIPMTDACWDLYWIAVDANLARKGVGGRLLGFMERFAAKRGARRIYVDTSSTPPYEAGRAFYGKHGHRLVCALEDFYRPGDDKLVYMKDIENEKK